MNLHANIEKASISELLLIFLSGICFFTIQLLCINYGNLNLIFATLCIFIFPLPFIYFYFRSISPLSVLIYLIIGSNFFIRFLIPAIPALIFIFTIFIFPIIFYHQHNSHNNNSLPLRLPFLLLITGFFFSFYSIVIKSDGNDFFNFYYDLVMLSGLCFFYCIYYFLSNKLINQSILIDILIISCLAFIGFTLLKYFYTFSYGSLFKERYGTSIRINPNLIASFLDLIFPLALFNLIKSRHSKKKYYYLTASLSILTILLLTSSRGSILGLIGLYIFILFRFSHYTKLTISLLLIPIIILLMFKNTLFSRIISPSHYDLLSDMGRLELIKTSFKILKENNYLFGIGLNNFRIVKFRYGFPLWFDPKMVMSSHNAYLEFWIGWGLAGVAGWSFIFLKCIHSIIKALRKKKDQLFGVSFALISFFIHGFVDSSIADFSIMLIFFTLLALLSYMLQND